MQRRIGRNFRYGFTLTEVLVVTGIIVVLTGLALPMIMRSYRAAGKTRVQGDLALIGTALEAYKQDFGDYPRFTDGTTSWLDLRSDRGAVLLCRALIGPGPMGTVADVDTGGQSGADGADGPGFRTRRSMSVINGDPAITGKVYGPYVQPDKFTLGGMDKTNFADATINDRYGNPILYYPAIPNHAAITANGGFVAVNSPSNPAAIKPLYNAFDNTAYAPAGTPTYLSLAELQTLMNADTTTGAVATDRTPSSTGPYLLWSAGADGIYGRVPSMVGGTPTAGDKTDDVTNFDFPAEMRK